MHVKSRLAFFFVKQMEKFWFVFGIIFLIKNCLIICQGQQQVQNETGDGSALLAFKSFITSDPYRIMANWSSSSSSNGASSVCDWFGVSCSKNKRVMALNLSGLNLEGKISPHLGNLTFLNSLDVSNNSFSGFIPVELSSLRDLGEINVGFNNLSGELPPWLGAMPELHRLVLNNNNFTGIIPPSLFNSTKLEILNIGYNFLYGSIPEEISNVSSLRMLNLRQNQLSGSVPSGIFSISSMEVIDIATNGLSGTLPLDIMCKNLSRLSILSLFRNNFQGEIPSELYRCRDLEVLSLSFNQFNGQIPREFGYFKNIKQLYLVGNMLTGEIPSGIGNLTQLIRINFGSNFLTGEIPLSIFNISSLRTINFSNNSLSGSLTANYNLSVLEELLLAENKFHGQLPSFIWECKSLKALSLGKNNFTGQIPKKIGNLTLLQDLNLQENKLTGELPIELGNNGHLVQFFLDYNDLSGHIPPDIFNMSSLVAMALDANNFIGPLPSNMWMMLPNIERIYLSDNKFGGTIPSSISNATKLTLLAMIGSSLTGPLPRSIGDLRFLSGLFLGNNNLTGESSNQGLRFITSLTKCRQLERVELSLNQFRGFLPSSIGNLSSSLRYFNIFDSKITGTIPSEIGNLSRLEVLNMDSNELTGFIPSSIGKLARLDRIYLEHNRLQGLIPPEICQLRNLGDLYLNDNMFSGSIPDCLGELKSLGRLFLQSNNFTSRIPLSLWNLEYLLQLNLSSNSLTGNMPQEVQNLKVLTAMDLSWNNLSGEIPSSLGSSESLVFLSLAHNMFEGGIPSSFGNIISLETLDLSQNNFSGTIPRSLEKLQNLKNLNLSFNRLEGEIPKAGSFGNFTAASFMQNYALCGSTRLDFPPCPVETSHRSRTQILKYILPPIAAAILITAIIITFMRIQRRIGMVPEKKNELSIIHEWRQISYYELVKATNSFSEDTLLGTGSFGSVYKGTLSDGSIVAVKVFHMQSEAANKSFLAECEVLGSIRHRNLVRILSCCTNSDFKALVLDYLSNGSLEMWLHSENINYFLDMSQRLNIAIDVASALEYLHHDHTQPVVHCDLKPSNILLDEGMNAHLCDFSISKLFDVDETMVQTKTLASIGYMSPEYGAEGIVSTSGDVYSYGIILLEIFTKKKPTDDMFEGGLNLKDWVMESMEKKTIMEVVDRSLNFLAKEEFLYSIFGLAMECLADSPKKRINMRDAVATLQKIQTAFTIIN